MTSVAAEYEERIWRIVRRRLGLETGKEFMAGWLRAQSDVEFGLLFLWGAKPYRWQRRDIFDAFEKGAVVSIGRLSNGGGKTTGFVLWYLDGCATRRGAPENWPLYRAIHFTPQVAHSTELRIKIDEFMRGRAREQWDRDRQEFRAAPMRYFVRAVKFEQHHGYEFFPDHDKKNPERDFVSATLTMLPTAGKGEAGEGSDPMLIGLDEGRHERNLHHIFYRIWLPRALRVESKIFMPYTSLEASPDLEAIKYQAEQDTNGDFHQFDHTIDEVLRDPNSTIVKKQVDRVLRILPKHIREQVRTGKASQPLGARLSMAAIEEAFPPPPEDPLFSVLEGLRERMERRCRLCRERKAGHPARHLLVGGMDPASSAKGADAIVAKVWDCDPPVEADSPLVAETVYSETLEAGSRIQAVAAHLNAMAREISGPVGYDRKSALGHNIEDLLYELDPDGEYVAVQWNSREEKARDVDFFKGLVEGRHWRSASFHYQTRSEAMNYQIEDRALRTDHFLTEVLCAKVAQPYLSFYVRPDGVLERVAAPKADERDGGPYAGMSNDIYAGHSNDIYAGAGR